jgi:hypothetical protein
LSCSLCVHSRCSFVHFGHPLENVKQIEFSCWQIVQQHVVFVYYCNLA